MSWVRLHKPPKKSRPRNDEWRAYTPQELWLYEQSKKRWEKRPGSKRLMESVRHCGGEIGSVSGFKFYASRKFQGTIKEPTREY